MQEKSFESWKGDVDDICIQKYGMPSDSFPDVDYIGLYKTGNTPEEAVEFVIENYLEN